MHRLIVIALPDKALPPYLWNENAWCLAGMHRAERSQFPGLVAQLILEYFGNPVIHEVGYLKSISHNATSAGREIQGHDGIARLAVFEILRKDTQRWVVLSKQMSRPSDAGWVIIRSHQIVHDESDLFDDPVIPRRGVHAIHSHVASVGGRLERSLCRRMGAGCRFRFEATT
jgi:hypothetical protein